MDTGSDSATMVVAALLVGGAFLASLVAGIVASTFVKKADASTVRIFTATIFVILLLLVVLLQDQVLGILTGGA
jgi:hypothetical protein